MRTGGQLFLPLSLPQPGQVPLATAPIGGLASWTTRSSRDPAVWYTVVLYPDGTWGCDCPAVLYGSRSDGCCKHIDERREDWRLDADLAAVP